MEEAARTRMGLSEREGDALRRPYRGRAGAYLRKSVLTGKGLFLQRYNLLPSPKELQKWW